MIKKFVLAFFLVFLAVYSVSAVYAAYNATESANTIDYPLPYPGILPDSPLWPLKDLRDKVVGLFIFDPVAKGQYQIRLGDKKLAMAEVLINNGKKDLGEKVLVWAADEFQRAIDKTNEAKLKKLNYESLTSRLSLFATKYSDVSQLSQVTERVKSLFVENLEK